MTQLPPVILATGALSLAAAALGFSLGLKTGPVTETEVIEAFAADYVAETGGAPTDCSAVPDPRPGISIVVSCGTGTAIRVYPVDERGRLVTVPARPST